MYKYKSNYYQSDYYKFKNFDNEANNENNYIKSKLNYLNNRISNI